MTDEPSIITMDEAGNTGENLLDRDQPVFALAAVHMSAERAQALVDAALSRTQSTTGSFKKSLSRGFPSLIGVTVRRSYG